MFFKSKELINSILVFVISSILILISVYFFIPLFMSKGLLFAEAYLFCFHFTFILLFIGAFILYKKEGNSFTLSSFSKRLRLKKFDKKSTKILFIFIFLSLLGFFLSYITGNLIAKNIPLLSPPDFLPAELNVNKSFKWGYIFDLKLERQWWFAVAYFIGWLFNIFGEELMFRGMLLPIQEKYWGNKTWIIHTILWGLWHIYWMWAFMPIMVFIGLPLIFAVNKTKNTWTGVIIHGSLNFTHVAYIFFVVIKNTF